jgi:hypothetical protein
MQSIPRQLQRPGGTLHALLDANLRLPPEYRDQLTNHLPMALHALHSLGATDQRLQDFYASYARRFQDPGAPEPVIPARMPPENWLMLRGQEQAYPALLRHFNDAVAQLGGQETLQRVLPDLMPGVCAAAFHGVIRTAHAVQTGHTQELAAALAYWAWRWQALAPPPPTDGSVALEFDTWAARLVRESAGWRSDGPLISMRMAHASQSPLFQALAGILVPANSLTTRIAELAGWAVAGYVANPNFTVLHIVTGSCPGYRPKSPVIPGIQTAGSAATCSPVSRFLTWWLASAPINHTYGMPRLEAASICLP